MATNAQKINLMMSRLGQRQSTRLREDLVQEINASIEYLEQNPFIPWFLASTETLNIVPGNSFVNLPSGYLREVEETQPYMIFEGRAVEIKKVTIEELELYDGTSTKPEVYTIMGNEFHFRPTAVENYTVFLRCYRKTQDEIADNSAEITNPWMLNAFEYLAASALKNVAFFHIRNNDLGNTMATLEGVQKRILYNFHESRAHENQDYYVGGISNGA